MSSSFEMIIGIFVWDLPVFQYVIVNQYVTGFLFQILWNTVTSDK